MRIATLFLFSAASLVASQDCDTICAERQENIIREKDELWHSREAIIREKDELWHSREAIIREKDELWHSREAIIKEKDEFFHRSENLGRELEEVRANGNVEELRASLNQQQEEARHYQKVAEENQSYMTEYKNELATQRDRYAKLETALKEATKKVDDLENASVGKKLAMGVKQFMGAFKSSGAPDL